MAAEVDQNIWIADRFRARLSHVPEGKSDGVRIARLRFEAYEQELREMMRERIADYKIPERILFPGQVTNGKCRYFACLNRGVHPIRASR